MGFIADVVTSWFGADAQRDAAHESAQASQEATDRSLALQKEMFDTVWGATAKQRGLGDAATDKLSGLLNGTVDPTAWVQSTPNYQSNLDAGARALRGSQAVQGKLLSGDAAREAISYNSDYINNVFNQERNALLAQAGLGQVSTSTGANAAGNYANSSQNALMNNANALSSSYQNSANATSGFWGSVGGSLNSSGNALAKIFGGF